MNKWMFVPTTVVLTVAATGCSTQSAPGLKGHWEPVNRFAETTQEIPIDPPHIFYATPADTTLKSLLVRWAKDSNMALSYRHPSDYTLYSPVVGIRTSDLGLALAALNTAYAEQRVVIAIDQRTIVVEQQSPAGPGGAADTKETGAAAINK